MNFSLFTMVLIICMAVLGGACSALNERTKPAGDLKVAQMSMDPIHYRMVAEELAKSIIAHGLRAKSSDKPVVAMGAINNHTHISVPADLIADTIQM